MCLREKEPIHRAPKAQGATEYLILLGVLLVLTLVTIGILSVFPNSSGDIRISLSKSYWGSTTPLAIYEHSMSTEGVLSLRVFNRGPQTLRLEKIQVAGDDVSGQNLSVVEIASGKQVERKILVGRIYQPYQLYAMSVNLTYSDLDSELPGQKLIGKEPIVGHSSGEFVENYSVEVLGCIDVNNGMVTTENISTANVTVVGSSITYGEQYDVPVTVRLEIGNQQIEPWGNYTKPVDSNLNDNDTHQTYIATNLSVSTNISITSVSWVKKSSGYDGTQNWHWKALYTRNSFDDPQYVKILRDGDNVPDIPAFENQAGIRDYVQKYVYDGKIKLADNQVIFLYELGTTDLNSPAADFQDLVLLISQPGKCKR